MRRLALACTLALLLVALPACDDGGDLAAPSEESPSSLVTSFSNKSISDSDLRVDGVVETNDRGEGRVELNVSGALDKSGADRASTPALQGLPSEISFDGRTMTYTTADGGTRRVELSEREATLLKNALEGRAASQRDAFPDAEASRTDARDLDAEAIQKLEAKGLQVTDRGDGTYEIVQPSENGGVAVRSIYDADTGTLTRAEASHNGDTVTRITPSLDKSGSAQPSVDRVE